jgi:hypothetical protein
VALREGLEAWRGEGCGCVSVPHIAAGATGCDDDCALGTAPGGRVDSASGPGVSRDRMP